MRQELNRTETIPVFAPQVGADELAHLAAAIEVGWLGMGASTKEFEDLIGAFLGLRDRYVVTTNTGTAALHIALRAAGVGPGDEVITPSFNYVADHQAIHMCGADVVMCDIRDDNLGIDCQKADALCGPRTKAIVPLHFAGIPCDIAGVYELASQRGLRVIEDACHGFGSQVDGRRLGSFGDIAAFSFDPVKVVTSIDGGCVVVRDPDELERLRRLRLLGIDRDTTERYKNRRAWDYDVVSEGYRYHLTNILASVGISQIKRVEDFIRTRQAVCRQYSDAFASLPGVKTPATDFSGVSPFIYSLRVLGGKRQAMVDHLRSLQIDAGIHFVPVHRHTFFKDARRGGMSVTDRVVEEVLTLPLHSCMRQEFVERVVDGVQSFFR
jgi:dTDP-4-amino-4,6-dideoxygalactose transaminase